MSARSWSRLRSGDTATCLLVGDALRDVGRFNAAAATYGRGRAAADAIERIGEVGLERSYRRAVKAGVFAPLRDLLVMYAEQGRLDAAERICRDVASKGRSEALIALGDVYRLKGQNAKARRAFVDAAERGSWAGLTRLSAMLVAEEDFAEAEATARSAIEHGALSGYLPLGDALVKQGRTAEAARAWKLGVDAGVSGAKERLAQAPPTASTP